MLPAVSPAGRGHVGPGPPRLSCAGGAIEGAQECAFPTSAHSDTHVSEVLVRGCAGCQPSRALAQQRDYLHTCDCPCLRTVAVSLVFLRNKSSNVGFQFMLTDSTSRSPRLWSLLVSSLPLLRPSPLYPAGLAGVARLYPWRIFPRDDSGAGKRNRTSKVICLVLSSFKSILFTRLCFQLLF